MILGVLWGLSACSSDEAAGSKAGNDPNNANQIESGDIHGQQGDAGSGVGFEKPKATVVSIQTFASPNEAQAGYPVSIACAPVDADGNLIEGVAVGFEVVNPPYPVHLGADTVTFDIVGTYAVRCFTKDEKVVDDSPDEVVVIAGDGVQVDTALDVHEVIAGEKVTVTCTVHDQFGNLNEWQTVDVVSTPSGGWIHSGLVLKMITADTYAMACRVPATAVVDKTPETLVVLPALPRKVVTLLDPETIDAGKKSKLTCKVTDAFGNVVKNFPVSVKVPAAVQLAGLSVTTKVAGLYPVQCVPASDPWEWYELISDTLHVLPGPPATLYIEQIPPKPVYQKNDTLELAIAVLDAFANVIPDAEIDPITISPPDGVKVNGETTFQFLEEGKYVFGIVVTQAPEIHDQLEILVDGTGPDIVIEKPARGATLTGKPAVNVSGYVNDDIAGVVSLQINGDEVVVKPDGTFTHILLASQGMNVIIAEATNLGNKSSRTSRAFYYSPVWYPIDAATPDEGKVPKGFGVWLGQGFLDDGVHEPSKPNDLATIIENLVANLDLGSVLPNPAADLGTYKLYINNLKFNKPTLGLDAFNGGIGMKVKIPNLNLNMKFSGTCKILFIDLCPDVSGSVSANAISIAADVLASSPNGQPQISVGGVNVSIDDLDIDIDGILGWLFDWLIDWIVGSFSGQIESMFEDQVASQAADIVKELIEAFALNTSFDIPPLLGAGDPVTLMLTSNLSQLQFTDDGGQIGLDANIVTAKKVTQKPLGSIGRASCMKKGEPPYEPDTTKDFGIGLHDDVLNQALFSIWWGGVLNMTLGKDVLGDVGGDAVAGIEDLTIKTLFFTPPILTSCNPAEQLKVQIADLFLDVHILFFGIELQLGIFASFEAEADLVVTTDAATGEKLVGIELLGVTQSEIEIVSITPGFEDSKQLFADMIQTQLLDGLVDGIGGEALGGFPIPSIDLSTLDPSIPAGTMLNIQLNKLERIYGFTVIDGSVD